MGISTREVNPSYDQCLAFVDEYLLTRNQAKAAIAAGYAASNTAAGTRLFKHPTVTEILSQRALEAAAAADVKVAEVLRATKEIATLDPALCFEDMPGKGAVKFRLKSIKDIPPEVRRCISSFKVAKVKGPGGGFIDVIEVKFWNKVAALDLLAQHLGMLTVKHEHTISVKQQQTMTDQELMAQQQSDLQTFQRHMEARSRMRLAVGNLPEAKKA